MKLFLAIILILAFPNIVFSFDLAWTPASPQIQEGFKIYRKKPTDTNYSLLASTLQTTTSYSDPDRTIGNCYKVTAFNFVGESSPLENCASVPGAISILILK